MSHNNYSYPAAGYTQEDYAYYYGYDANAAQPVAEAAAYDPNFAAPPPVDYNPNAPHFPVSSVPLGYDQGLYIKPNETKTGRKARVKKTLRNAAGKVWEDHTLLDWKEDDFRLFAGDLGPEVSDDVLKRAFDKYPSFIKARVVRDKRSEKSKGYGFISFRDAGDFVKAWKEMNGKYVGNRPIKLRKSTWKERCADPKTVRAKKY